MKLPLEFQNTVDILVRRGDSDPAGKFAAHLLTQCAELIRRRLDRSVGDCQVYWEYDARQLLGIKD